VIVARSKNGQAIRPERRTPEEVALLRALLQEAESAKGLATWRRAKSVLGYLDGQKVIALSEALEVTRGSINRWLQWYQAMGAEGLRNAERPGPTPRLSEAQKAELATIIEAGPQAAGFTSGMWTGPMIRDLIRRRFGVRYHNHHIPRLLGWMGFSVQRPRKRLARADAEAQAVWLRHRLPAIKKKPALPRHRDLRGRGQLLARRHAAPDVVPHRQPAAGGHLRAAEDRARVRRGYARPSRLHLRFADVFK
jgi:transposase